MNIFSPSKKRLVGHDYHEQQIQVCYYCYFAVLSFGDGRTISQSSNLLLFQQSHHLNLMLLDLLHLHWEDTQTSLPDGKETCRSGARTAPEQTHQLFADPALFPARGPQHLNGSTQNSLPLHKFCLLFYQHHTTAISRSRRAQTLSSTPSSDGSAGVFPLRFYSKHQGAAERAPSMATFLLGRNLPVHFRSWTYTPLPVYLQSIS